MSSTFVDPDDDEVPAAHDFTNPDKISTSGAVVDFPTDDKSGETKMADTPK